MYSSTRESAARIINRSLFYPILDQDYNRRFNLDPLALLTDWRDLGIEYYQWRCKTGTSEEYLRTAREMRKQFPGLVLMANDHLDIALEHPDIFGGIHLGQEDLAALNRDDRLRLKEAARNGFITGTSTHGIAQYREADESDIDWAYIALGPIASTHSKPTGTDPVLAADERIQVFEMHAESRRARPEHERKGLVLIGGLDESTLDSVLPRDFTRTYGFMPIIASISAAARPGSAGNILKKLRMYIA